MMTLNQAISSATARVTAARTQNPPGSLGLSTAIDQVIAQDPNLDSAHWGLVVQNNKGQVVYQHDADKLFAPASNMKMITAATANHILGPQSRFQTRLLTDGKVDDSGVLQGNLYLVGGGDPSLASSDLKSAASGLGFQKVAGNLVVDDHCFDATRLGPGWMWDDFSANYGAEIDGLTVDEGTALLHVNAQGVEVDPQTPYLKIANTMHSGASTQLQVERELGTNQVNVGGVLAKGDHRNVAVSVHDPALYAGNVLKSFCQDQGISLEGQVVRGNAPKQTTQLWETSSAPLITLEKHMLKESDNLYAETLFRALAKGQSADAPALENQTLNLTTPHKIADGCGLSRLDLLSPNLLAGVVQNFYRDPALRDCLPVAGVDGTLKHRMADLKGRVEAKTGTMTGVSTLSGWLTAQDGKEYSFAWMCNDYPGVGAKATEDKLLTAMDKSLSSQSV